MNRFKLYSFVTLFLVIFCSHTILGFDIPIHSALHDTIVLKKEVKQGNKIRPNTPKLNTQYVTCSFDGESLNITLTTSEGFCRGTVTEEASPRINLISFDSSQLEVSLPITLTSDYYIEFTTEKGNTYYGSTAAE